LEQGFSFVCLQGKGCSPRNALRDREGRSRERENRSFDRAAGDFDFRVTGIRVDQFDVDRLDR
jgi:hypothetical protein